MDISEPKSVLSHGNELCSQRDESASEMKSCSDWQARYIGFRESTATLRGGPCSKYPNSPAKFICRLSNFRWTQGATVQYKRKGMGSSNEREMEITAYRKFEKTESALKVPRQCPRRRFTDRSMGVIHHSRLRGNGESENETFVRLPWLAFLLQGPIQHRQRKSTPVMISL